MAVPLRLIDSSTWSGSGLPPCSSITSAPASWTSHSRSTPVASRTRRVASAISGPVPSPGMKVTRCATPRETLARVDLTGPGRLQAVNEFRPGLEGVVAFETEIAEPDREGGALRYRGVDIEDLVGQVPYEKVWGLLVDGTLQPGLPPAEPHPLAVRSGDPRVDVQSCLAMLGPEWGMRALIDIDDEQARSDL